MMQTIEMVSQYKAKLQELGVKEQILEQMCEGFVNFLDTLKEGYLKGINPEEHAIHDFENLKNPIKYGHPH